MRLPPATYGSALPLLCAALLVAAGGCGGTTAPTGAWELTWSDEFEGAAGARPDPTKWGADVGNGVAGWGNSELESYQAENAALDGSGHLVITANRDTVTAADGTKKSTYTSARLITKGRFEQKYGKFEARIKLPGGPGIWPAFWLLGADVDTNAWPACGEIDVMEAKGQEPSINHGSLHGPGYSGGKAITNAGTLLPTTDGFHTFTVEWDVAQIVFKLDDREYEVVQASALPEGARWVYDHPFFLILNVAVGGNYVGNPSPGTPFPQTMVVDYVRAWKRAQ